MVRGDMGVYHSMGSHYSDYIPHDDWKDSIIEISKFIRFLNDLKRSVNNGVILCDDVRSFCTEEGFVYPEEEDINKLVLKPIPPEDAFECGKYTVCQYSTFEPWSVTPEQFIPIFPDDEDPSRIDKKCFLRIEANFDPDTKTLHYLTIYELDKDRKEAINEMSLMVNLEDKWEWSYEC